MPDVPESDKRYEILLEEMHFAVDQQFEELRTAQNRAGQLLQFGGLLGTFLGSVIIRTKQVQVLWMYSAALAFAALTVSVIVAIYPRVFEFAITNDRIWGVTTGSEFTVPITRAALAKYLEFNYKANLPKLRLVRNAYRAGITALSIELIYLLLAMFSNLKT